MPDAARALQPAHEVARGAPVRRLRRVPFHHHPLGHRIAGFVILGVHADIADMGEGEGHDLPGIGGVGHDLLVARHRGVEAELGHAHARRAEPVAVEQGAVGKREAGGGGLWSWKLSGGQLRAPVGRASDPNAV
jgi:hypothetical protein